MASAKAVEDAAALVPARPEKEIPLQLEPQSAAVARGAGTMGLVGWVSDLALKLGIVLVLAYVCLYGLRRFVPGASAVAPGKEMGIRRTIVLGAGRSVHLLDVDGHHILIGATAQQITLLADLTEPAVSTSAEMEAARMLARAGAPTFEAHLDGLMGGAADPTREAETAAASPAAETYTDDELREEMRKRLFAMNRSASGIAKLHDTRKGDGRR